MNDELETIWIEAGKDYLKVNSNASQICTYIRNVDTVENNEIPSTKRCLGCDSNLRTEQNRTEQQTTNMSAITTKPKCSIYSQI